MENRKIQFRSKACNLHLSAYPGHFATKHSHVNYFLDMTTLKVRQSNAEEAARALVPLYKHNTVVDTIVCLDGTEVIGAFLAVTGGKIEIKELACQYTWKQNGL